MFGVNPSVERQSVISTLAMLAVKLGLVKLLGRGEKWVGCLVFEPKTLRVWSHLSVRRHPLTLSATRDSGESPGGEHTKAWPIPGGSPGRHAGGRLRCCVT